VFLLVINIVELEFGIAINVFVSSVDNNQTPGSVRFDLSLYIPFFVDFQELPVLFACWNGHWHNRV